MGILTLMTYAQDNRWESKKRNDHDSHIDNPSRIHFICTTLLIIYILFNYIFDYNVQFLEIIVFFPNIGVIHLWLESVIGNCC